ncbi:MAG: protein tyrosine phosphatase [Myxococcales bacterium]|nr:protein tyrosine phosphatase [Myxococcales bacterium]
MARKLLFVCSRARRRSLTAERVFSSRPGLSVRSAGTEEAARVRVTARMLAWADLVFVMERRHLARLRQRFPAEAGALARDGRIVVLDIPDLHECMAEELVIELTAAVEPYLDD